MNQQRKNDSPMKPDAFLWGAATAAYQVEGAAFLDGKGHSVWDAFCTIPGSMANGDTGEVACDQYHRFRDDIELMGRMNLNAYRFSISWPRVLPQGRGPVNERGMAYYERLIDALLKEGIEPLVTLYHWDLPNALQRDYEGWLHQDSPHFFADYAELLFKRLGDRVKFWITLNEPWVVVDAGYFHGVHPPGLKDRPAGYRAGHNLLRAHAYAVQRFREQGVVRDGQISFALNTTYSSPASRHALDDAAAERAMLNFAGWFGDPVYFGDYPAVMRERLGTMLPHFTDEDQRLLRRSTDYTALNYYFSDVVRHAPGSGPMEIEILPQPERVHTETGWPITPEGFHLLLQWLHKRYAGLPIYITENGAAMNDHPDESSFVDDQDRIAYLRSHIDVLMAARSQGVDIRGYFAWSLLDNLEWTAGYAKRFGLVHCDRKTLQRTMKASGHWYAKLIADQQNQAALEPMSCAV